MPVPIGRDRGHAAHDQGRRHAELAARGDLVRLADQEAAERDPRAQAARRRRNCIRSPARRTAHPARPCPRPKPTARFRRCDAALCGEMTPSPLCRILWPTKNASSYLSRSSWLRSRLLMSTVPGASKRARTRAPRLAAVAVEPANLEAVALADVHQILERERHLALAALLRRPLDVRKIVVPRFLPDADQQLRELPPRRAGLRQQLRQGVLQQLMGEQKCGLQRHRLETAAAARRAARPRPRCSRRETSARPC